MNKKRCSDETRSKISAALKGRHFSLEHRRKLSALRTGTRQSEETKKLHSIASKKMWKRPGYREKRKDVRGQNSAHWRGGRIMDHSGYILIYTPYHHTRNNKGYVQEHRLVYERFHKCCLLPTTHIHHIDGNKSNNDPNNLVALSSHKHHNIHRIKPNRECIRCGSEIRRMPNCKRWYLGHIDKEGNVLCKRCDRLEIKEINKSFYQKRIDDLIKVRSIINLDSFIEIESGTLDAFI